MNKNKTTHDAYLVRFELSSKDGTMMFANVVKPDECGDVAFQVYEVADKAWLDEHNLFLGDNYEAYQLNNKWEVGLKGKGESKSDIDTNLD